MSVVVVATIRPIAEHRAEVTEALARTVARVHVEDHGCERYALHEGDDRLVMIEKWASPELLAAHGASAAFAELGEQLNGKLIGDLDVQILRPHPAGTVEQGQL
jgi:quinol monooxygenase YgiN